MANNYITGQVSATCEGETTVATWKIPYIYLFSDSPSVESPSFLAFGSRWRLCMSNIDCLGLTLVIINSRSPIKIYYKWGIKGPDGACQEYSSGIKQFSKVGQRISEEEVKLFRPKIKLTPSHILTVICRMSIENDLSPIFPDPGSRLKKRKKSERNGATELETPDAKHRRTLLKSMKHLYKESLGSDVTIRVKHREFLAHKVILSSRSPVFAAMFNHDMTESNTGIVTLDDCDPDAFDVFLLFLYSGEVANRLSGSNVYGLYYAADKYDLLELKVECSEFMSRNITLENFFNIVLLAHKYSDTKILDSVIVFFMENVESILKSDEWKKLLLENLDLANKLYLKGARSVGTEKWT